MTTVCCLSRTDFRSCLRPRGFYPERFRQGSSQRPTLIAAVFLEPTAQLGRAIANRYCREFVMRPKVSSELRHIYYIF